MSVGGRELACGVERGLAIALRERPTPITSPSTTIVVRTIGGVLSTDQVLQRDILYFSSPSASPISNNTYWLRWKICSLISG